MVWAAIAIFMVIAVITMMALVIVIVVIVVVVRVVTIIIMAIVIMIFMVTALITIIITAFMTTAVIAAFAAFTVITIEVVVIFNDFENVAASAKVGCESFAEEIIIAEFAAEGTAEIVEDIKAQNSVGFFRSDQLVNTAAANLNRAIVSYDWQDCGL